MKDNLVIGSRGSKLALTQASMIKTELERLEPSVAIRIEIIKTSGDANSDPLSLIGGKGVFTKELEEALLDSRIDIAVRRDVVDFAARRADIHELSVAEIP